MLLSAFTVLALGITSATAAPHSTGGKHCGSTLSAEAIAKAESDFTARKASLKQATNATSLFASTIPVYWHVITSGGPDPEESVTDLQIAKSIEVLNNDYAPSGISFTHINTDVTENAKWFTGVGAGNFYESEMKTALHQGTAATLNVYTAAPPLPDDPTSTLLGYATFPFDYTENLVLDGVVIRYSTVPGGSAPGNNLGKTLTHEVGHWLGLFHTFQGESCEGNGDMVDDTPPQKEMTNGGCPAGKDTCPGGAVDPIHNFMDYSDDACLTEFTPGQIARMQSMLSAYRSA